MHGNPLPSTGGDRTIELDDEWRWAMARRAKLAVTWRTLPLLLAYGYRPTDAFKEARSSDRRG